MAIPESELIFDLPNAGVAENGLPNMCGCAIAIDPQSFAIVTATESAIDALALAGMAFPYPLDAAMPLAEQVRKLVEGGLVNSRPALMVHPAKFWTRRLAAPVNAKLSLAQTPAGAMLVIVTLEPRTGQTEGDDDLDDDLPRSARSDAETLRAIGQAIRSGVPASIIPPSPSKASLPEASSQQSLAKFAHELKTPLGGILAATEVMRDARFGKIGNARYRGYIGDMHEAACHALTLLERWLNDGMEPRSRTVGADLNAIVRATAGILQPSAEAFGVTLDVSLNAKIPNIAADATAIRQIIFNLLANALKFTPAGGSVALATAHDAAGAVLLTVRDNGVGLDIAAARISLAQQPRTIQTSDRQSFGLAIVGELARANDATIDVDSTIGHGTVFRIAFQATRAAF